MPKRNPLSPPKPSENAEMLTLLGQFGLTNYKMGSNENKGRPDPDDVTKVERARNAFLAYLDRGGKK